MDDAPELAQKHRGACGKVCYPGKGAAMADLRRMQDRQRGEPYRGRLHVYPCEVCRRWHIGHTYR